MICCDVSGSTCLYGSKFQVIYWLHQRAKGAFSEPIICMPMHYTKSMSCSMILDPTCRIAMMSSKGSHELAIPRNTTSKKQQQKQPKQRPKKPPKKQPTKQTEIYKLKSNTVTKTYKKKGQLATHHLSHPPKTINPQKTPSGPHALYCLCEASNIYALFEVPEARG